MKSEAAVQREVVRYLKAMRAKVWRVGQRDARGTQDAGVSDLIVFHGGRCLFLEVKRSDGGRWSQAQREFCQAVSATTERAEYEIVQSLADVDRVLGVKELDSNIGPNIGRR